MDIENPYNLEESQHEATVHSLLEALREGLSDGNYNDMMLIVSSFVATLCVAQVERLDVEGAKTFLQGVQLNIANGFFGRLEESASVGAVVSKSIH